MKVITTLMVNWAMLMSAYSQMYSPSNIPRIQDNMCVGRMDGIVFPDPDNCDAFVQCQRGAVTRQRCQTGYLFDLGLFFCVPVQTTQCGSRRLPNSPSTNPNSPNSPPPSTESHHSVCRNRRNGDLVANPNNCRAYIECQQNLRLDRECKVGELFEARNGVCLSDFIVDCAARPILSNEDVAIRNVCAGQRDGARVPDPRDCSRFFECRNSQGVPRECVVGDLFETTMAICIFDAAVNCAGRGTNNNARPPTNRQGEVSRNICTTLPTGTRLSNPQNCRVYFECINGQRFEFSCPANQAFDIFTNQCRVASTVNCAHRASLETDSSQNSICQGQRNGQRFSNPDNCRAFSECQSQSRIDRTCESGQLFQTETMNCQLASTVRCGSRILPPSDVQPQSPEDFFPPCPRTGVSFRPHPHDCTSYFVCAGGSLVQHSCSPGIHFNPETLQCDFPQNVRCESRRIVIPQTPILPDCTRGENYFPNLVNCRQYYLCVNKLPRLMDCPRNHSWNNETLKCEQSESGSCTRRING